jgi:hypothetical protein
MADPKRPTLSPVPHPQKQVDPKSGQEHILYGCLMFGFGLAVIAGIMYTFREFFIAHAWTAIIGLYVVWKLYDLLISRLKKKNEK